MCGRYTLYEIEEIGDRYDVDVPGDIKPNFNVAPTQTMPVIKQLDGDMKVELMHWGIPRMLGKDFVKEIINTRSDKAFGGFWRKTVTTQRCLIPFNSFYEWKKIDGKKVPQIIAPKDGGLSSFAGIWSSWTDKEGKTFDVYSIMTTDPNEEMKTIHDRMPVILYPEEEKTWLDESLSNDDIAELLHPYEDNGLIIQEGSMSINNVRTNNDTLIVPVNSK